MWDSRCWSPETPWNVLEQSIRHPVLAHPCPYPSGSCWVRPWISSRLLQRVWDVSSGQEPGQLLQYSASVQVASYDEASPGIEVAEDRPLGAMFLADRSLQRLMDEDIPPILIEEDPVPRAIRGASESHFMTPRKSPSGEHSIVSPDSLRWEKMAR